MKRVYSEGITAIIAGTVGFLGGIADKHKMFLSLPFQIAFGIVFATLAALVIGGATLQMIDRRHMDKMKKRVRVSFDKDRTSIIVEPK